MAIASTFVRGQDAEDFAVKWLESNDFQVLARNLRPPREWGCGQVDVVALKKSRAWVVEVKRFGEVSFDGPLVSDAQKRRLYRSMDFCRSKWRVSGRRLDWGLLLLCCDPVRGSVEFLENP